MSQTTEVRTAFADEAFTVSSTALSLTASKYASDRQAADLAILTATVDAISYRVTGAVPTAATGNVLAAGQSLTLYGEANIRNFRMIRVTTDATVFVTYYRRQES